VLVVIMIISIIPTSFATTQFTDSSAINSNYIDAVNMLVELGVISGYPDGSFKPKNNITRAEFAKMAYILKQSSDTGSDIFAAQRSIFTDVEGNSNVVWAKGYINYCQNQGIISGVGNNKFNPQGNITVAAVAKMLVVMLGCDPIQEGFIGADWVAKVISKAKTLGVLDGWNGDPDLPATRELVAMLMWNTVFSSTSDSGKETPENNDNALLYDGDFKIKLHPQSPSNFGSYYIDLLYTGKSVKVSEAKVIKIDNFRFEDKWVAEQLTFTVTAEVSRIIEECDNYKYNANFKIIDEESGKEIGIIYGWNGEVKPGQRTFEIEVSGTFMKNYTTTTSEEFFEKGKTYLLKQY